MVTWLLLLRRINAGAVKSRPPTASKPPAPKAPSNPRSVRPDAPSGTRKNPSGNIDDAARAARTQPHGTAPARATRKTPRLPRRGTPERAAIEQARRQGVNAKKASELANIRAGGKGSGVWTEAELQQIRETGKFPADVRWHHDPTVANRPDLAADPSVVHPVRDGTQGHLGAHGGDFRKPSD